VAGCQTYKAGTFDWPGSTGVFSVTGLGFQPQAVILFGGNRPEEDTHVLGRPGPGLFISMNGVSYTDLTSVVSLCLFLNGASFTGGGTIGYGAIQSPTGCIRMCTDAASTATIDYRATNMSFDADGFSFNVTHTPASNRPIHWFAWGPAGSVATQTATMRENINVLAQPFDAGFDAYSALILTTVINDGASFGEGSIQGQCWLSFGSEHDPQNESLTANWNRLEIYDNVIYGTSLGNQGFLDAFFNFFNQHVVSTVGPAYIEGGRNFETASPSDRSEWVDTGGGESNEYHQAIWWNGESWPYSIGSLPALGDTSVFPVHSNLENFGAVLFATLTGINAADAGYFPLRWGFGILTEDYQGCVVFGENGDFYQSTNKCLANVDGTNLAAVEGSFVGNAFELEGLESTFPAINVGVGFSCPAGAWIPQMYRWWRNPSPARA